MATNAPMDGQASGSSGAAGNEPPWDDPPLEAERNRGTAWLSRGLETLIRKTNERRASGHVGPHYDFVVVGSGYGGSVAVSGLAGRTRGAIPVSVCLLERGSEYLQGAFPHRFSDLAGHVRFSTSDTVKARGRRDGLFDVRIGPDVCGLVANGLGGGSLINAGVMEWPHPSVFDDPAWPKTIREDASLRVRSDEMAVKLGAQPIGRQFQKAAAMVRLGNGKTRPAPITVANAPGPNRQGVHRRKCIGCGDCATGCNHEAKQSLDVTLLAAVRDPTLEIYTGATVLKIEKTAAGWQLQVVHTDDQIRGRQREPLPLCASNVILCAGTYGTTEILLRSATKDLHFSSKLGAQFSANGDILAVAYGTDGEVNATADEGTNYASREVGPTITSIVDLREGNADSDVVIEDLAIPGPLRRLFEEIYTTANAVHDLQCADRRWHRAGAAVEDPNAVNPAVIMRTLPVAMIGRDSADGRLRLVPSPPAKSTDDVPTAEDLDGDGGVTVVWPTLGNDRRPDAFHDRLAGLLRVGKLGGRLIANPMWRLLPPAIESVLGEVRGPVFTVHPLGGCPMGDDVHRGVVDQLGRVYDGVYDAATPKPHKGLYVLDGAMIPTSLGINPALTIATLADRAVCALSMVDWQLDPPGVTPAVPVTRPVFRTPPPAVPPAATKFEFTEQIRGDLRLDNDGGLDLKESRGQPLRIALRLWFEPVQTADLCSPSGKRTLDVDGARSRLIVYAPGPWAVVPDEEAKPLLEFALAGTLTVFRHAPSNPLCRLLRGGWAWFINRGLRDIVQFRRERRAGIAPAGAGLWPRVVMAAKLATRAGDRRLLEYDLTIGNPIGTPDERVAKQWTGQSIRGRKCVTYGRAANPWVQLMRTRLTRFPFRSGLLRSDLLEVDLPYFGWAGVPLLHFVEQQDQPSALADLGSVFGYILRTLLHVHTWSLRKPDLPEPRTPCRLPGSIAGIVPEPVEFEVAKPLLDGTPVFARLTRYRKRSDGGPPVLMIHGYSAGGTTFAHPTLPHGGLAGYLAGVACRDVWVLDLRTSPGMPTATHEWSFEEVGREDIPQAVDYVRAATGHDKIDVVAHCMGVAMLTLALLPPFDAKARAGGVPAPELVSRVRKLVMSQVAPVGLAMSAGNLFRAYLLRYIKNFLRIDAYTFRPEGPRSGFDDLLDRVLSTVPYPDPREFSIENPIWPLGARTRWVATRHRMDALYGQTFNARNLSQSVREHIDDFFGPMNFQTVSQVIHFATEMRVTDRNGDNPYDPDEILKYFSFPCMHLQGDENGLVGIATARIAGPGFAAFAREFVPVVEKGMGHQDCLIGKDAGRVFVEIERFLAQ